jgi:hypothetical protein
MTQISKPAILLALAASLLTGTAIAGETEYAARTAPDDIQVGQGVVCDTAEQVQRITTLLDESPSVENAITTINTEASNPRACGLVLAAFVRGNEVAEAHKGVRSLKVVEITILAVPVGNEWHFVQPLKQYTAFAPKGIEI